MQPQMYNDFLPGHLSHTHTAAGISRGTNGSAYLDTVPAKRYAGMNQRMKPIIVARLISDDEFFHAPKRKYKIKPPIKYHG